MPTLKVCIVCGTTTDQTRCPKHRRGNTTQRQYGSAHQRLRSKWKPLVEAGEVECWRCGELIDPAEGFDLGHDDRDRTKYRGPEHITCNRGTQGRR